MTTTDNPVDDVMSASIDTTVPGTLDTRVLVDRAQEGNRPSAEELFLRFRPRLEGWITLKMGDHLKQRVDVEELVQETQLSAFKSISQFQGRGDDDDFWHWLMRIALNRIRDAHKRHFKARKRSAEREQQLVADLTASWTSASLAARRREKHELTIRAFQLLDEASRDILRLRIFEGLTNAQAAEILGIEVSHVRTRLTRAKRKLVEKMQSLHGDWTW